MVNGIHNITKGGVLNAVKNRTRAAGKALYEVHCTECGQKLTSRFFALGNLLKHYSNGRDDKKEKSGFIKLLGIGALYGQPILPEVRPLLEDGVVQKPDIDAIGRGREIPCIACERDNVPEGDLVPVDLNISAIVAQFVAMSGFEDFYTLLEIQQEKNKAAAEDSSISQDSEKLFQHLCNALIGLPGVTVGGMGKADTRAIVIEKALDWVLESARQEEILRAADPGRTNFSTEQFRAVWRYEEINGRKMPAALIIRGSSGTEYFNGECCCGTCRRQIPVSLGAYEQRIVGLLGTQSTGKTTYLSALADAIDWGELTRSTDTEGSTARISVRACMEGDQNWKRAKAEPPAMNQTKNDSSVRNPAAANQTKYDGSDKSGNPAEENKLGMLWLYQHGFPPEKTQVDQQDASALTYLVSRKDGSMEPVMYTLADISGEAFQNTVMHKYDSNFLEQQHQLLNSCYALILIISARQMHQSGKDNGSELIDSPGAVLNCCRTFLPNHSLPTAVVMTCSDEINNGELRKPLNLAYDIRRVPSLISSGRLGHAAFNAEQMRTSIHAVNDFINLHFGNFVQALRQTIRDQQKGGGEVKVASFAISSGTQLAPYYYLDDVDDDYSFRTVRPGISEDMDTTKKRLARNDAYHHPDEETARVLAMRKARFGICAPLQWLLAVDGMLDVDYRDDALDAFPENIRLSVKKRIEQSLYR